IEKCCVASCSSEPFSELSSREGVARVDVAGLVADLEPANALRGRTVCKRFRHDVAARTLLQAVVADLARGVQAFFDVAGLQQLPLPIRVVRPDARETVGLQLLPH